MKPINGCIFTGLVSMMLAGSSAYAAAVFDPDTQPYWQTAPFTLKSTKLTDGATKAYQPWFENGAWQGDLKEYDIAANGTRTAGNWTARAVFAEKESTVTDYWKARKIITHDGTSQVAFRWQLLTGAQAQALDPHTAADAGATGAYDSPVLNYVRGDRSQEETYNTRIRHSLLGDIIHSQPLYVGGPAGTYSLDGYASFKDTHKDRAGRIYVGANDGMIHVFNSQDGAEVYAYVPSILFPNLARLTSKDYINRHTYYVDGQLVAGDAKLDGDWLTVLAVGLGAGGKGLFALDITNPDLSDETASTGTDAKILWERTGSSLGHVYGRLRVARLPDGNWYVVSGNGFGSDDEIAKLVLAPVGSGATNYISTGVGTGNGLAAPALVDTDHDGDADYAYAGDLEGNLWKFDLSSSTASMLFTAGDSQPITSAPEVTNHPYGGRLIYFGTGSLLSDDDADNTDQQAIYAVWDKPGNANTVDTADLLTQTLTAATHTGGTDVRLATGNGVNWSTQYGWKLNLPGSGERLLGNPRLRDGRLVFITSSPDQKGWLMGLDWLSGGEPDQIQFDLDHDDALDADDTVTVDGNARSPAGRLLGTANYAQPSIAQISNGSDILYINGLASPVPVEPCVGLGCGGILGGEISVRTPNSLGAGAGSFSQDYDGNYDVTYYDLTNPLAPNLPTPADQIADGDLGFVVTLTNADLNHGGTLTIGTKEWNVLEYQEMLLRQLENWDGASPLVDYDGDSLVYTLNGISAAGGTIRVGYNDQSIANGGIFMAHTNCITANASSGTDGRWRGGALSVQLLDFNQIKAGLGDIEAWVVHHPVETEGGTPSGGIRANTDNPDGFLFEATIYWDVQYDLAQEVIGVKNVVCYGEEEWEEATGIEIAGLTRAIIQNQFPDDAAQIEDLVIRLRDYDCEAGTGAQCTDDSGYLAVEEELDDLIKRYQVYQPYIHRTPTADAAVDDEGNPIPVEAVIQDESEDLSPVPGPDFTWGRRAWIDL